MTKEKFLYELIDNWLCMVSRQCVLIENYTQKDRTEIYVQCSEVLKTCMDFYDRIHRKMDSGEYSQNEVDEKLEYIVQGLKQETMRKFVKEIKLHMGGYIGTIEELIDEHLFGEGINSKDVFSKQSLICFMREVRKCESESRK